jgi:hypothetical protein
VLGTSIEHEIDLAFLNWANRRRFQRARRLKTVGLVAAR